MAAVDALAAMYLLAWALRRDRPAVLAVGVALVVCAAFLLVIGWPHPVEQLPPVGPGPGAPV